MDFMAYSDDIEGVRMTSEPTGFGRRLMACFLLPALLLPGLIPGSSALAAQEACPNPAMLVKDIQGPLAHVRFLADDALLGREVGSTGARCAADYIADYWRTQLDVPVHRAPKDE